MWEIRLLSLKESSKEAYWKKFFIGSITVRLAQNPKNSTAKSCRGALSERALPRIQKLFPLCITFLSVTAPGLPVPRGVSGGGAALSSLCRRFPGGDIMNLTSRRSPLSGLSFSEFFFLRERKTDWLRRSHKISVGEAKCYICRHKRAAALHLITACGRSCLAAARAGAVLGLHRRPIHCRAPASQPSRGRLSQRDAVTKSLSPNQNPLKNPSKKSFPHPANPYITVLYRSVNKIAPTFPQISPHNRRAVDNFCCVHRFSTSNDRMQIRKYPRKPLF